jgi:hypothetical protein
MNNLREKPDLSIFLVDADPSSSDSNQESYNKNRVLKYNVIDDSEMSEKVIWDPKAATQVRITHSKDLIEKQKDLETKLDRASKRQKL